MPKKQKSVVDGCQACLQLSENDELKWVYRNTICIIVPCPMCNQHILVFRRHGKPTDAEMRQIENVAGELYPNGSLNRATHFGKEHYHWHIME